MGVGVRVGSLRLRWLSFALFLVIPACNRSPNLVESELTPTQICSDLHAGQTVPVYTATGAVFGRYLLQRQSPTQSMVIVPVEFRDPYRAPDFWYARVNECLAQAAPRLGVGNQLISIAVVPPSQATERIAPFSVDVVASISERGHWQRWAAGWDCGMIVHETLHWVGLVDTYQEPSGIYPCRAVGSRDSIMHSPIEAWEKTTPLLMEGEATAILYPGCGQKNPNYFACAHNAYRTREQACLPSPEACGNGAWTLSIPL